MVRDTIFAPYVKERPLWVRARAVLERLVDAPGLDVLFACPAQQQSTRARLCSSLGQWMREGVLGVHPTVHAASQATNATLGGATTALDNTRALVATGVAAALVRDSAARAAPEGMTRPLGVTLPGPSPGGGGPAAPGDDRGVSARRRSGAGASLARPGAPARQGGAALERGAHRVPPGAEAF
jgi:hypothetical protein